MRKNMLRSDPEFKLNFPVQYTKKTKVYTNFQIFGIFKNVEYLSRISDTTCVDIEAFQVFLGQGLAGDLGLAVNRCGIEWRILGRVPRRVWAENSNR